MADRALTCRKSEWMDDWYTIEWAEHENTTTLERCAPGAYRLAYSGRVSDADVEGDGAEMLDIAAFLEDPKEGYLSGGYRCEAVRVGDTIELCSPRNSTTPGRITLEQGRHLASEIRRVVEVPRG